MNSLKQAERNFINEKTKAVIFSESGKELGTANLSIDCSVGQKLQFKKAKVQIIRVEKPSIIDNDFRVWIK
jgi:hypothetical protein